MGWVCYLPIVLLWWLLGAIVARYFSVPCDLALRSFLLSHERAPGKKPLLGGSGLMQDTDY